jgi:hypothetical protein
MKRTWSRYGLILAVAALGGCDAMTAHTDVVARVGAHELTESETVELLAGNPTVPARAGVIESVANLWVDYTALAELVSEDSTLAGLDMTQLVRPYVEQQTFRRFSEELMTVDTAIGEAELRAEFEERAPGLRIKARHILFTYPEEADEAARDSVQALAAEVQSRAAGGEDFGALAQEYSQDPGSAQAGGDLGWFQRGRMVKPFEDAAFALEPGEVSGVVETPFGLHIIKLDEREAPTWDPETADDFRQQLIQQRQQEAVGTYVDSLRESVGLEVGSGAVDVASELAENPGRRMSDRAAARELVTWEGGALTAREFAQALRALQPPQRAQFASASDEQLESVLRDLATNELVIAEAEEQGFTVPQAERDSIQELIVEQMNQVTRSVGLVGEAQEGETPAEAIDRRVRSYLEGIITGEQQMLPLGALSFVVRDEVDWQINESTFPAVVEELEERRAGQAQQAPAMPEGVEGQPGQQPPAEQQQPAPPGGEAPDAGADTTG